MGERREREREKGKRGEDFARVQPITISLDWKKETLS